jgi:hypothetical protein
MGERGLVPDERDEIHCTIVTLGRFVDPGCVSDRRN